MTVKDIEGLIQEVADKAITDPELAHMRQDHLYVTVLLHISLNNDELSPWELQDLADAALKVRELDFPRWT